MKNWGVFLVLIVFVLVPFASADIFFQDTFHSLYSAGDVVNASLSVKEQVPVSDYLESSIVCGSNSVVVSKNYLTLQANQQKSFNFSFPASITGDCYFRTSFDGDSQSSQHFTISSAISLTYSLNDITFLPGDTLAINGTAIKSNGEMLDGSVFISSPRIVNKTVEAKNGNFFYSFKLNDTLLPGIYNFSLLAFEKDAGGKIINSGQRVFQINIKPTPSSIFAPGNFSITPPYNLTFPFSLRDQAANPVANKSILLRVIDPSNNITEEQSINSPGTYTYYFQTNATKGFWKFNFYYGQFFTSTKVYVGENPQVSSQISSNSIKITNIGNVRYEGIVNYTFTNSSGVAETIPINVNLGVGESNVTPLDFRGNYNVSMNGNSLGSFSITGGVIGLSGGIHPTALLIAFLIVLALSGIFFFLWKKKFFEPLHLFKRKKIHKDYQYLGKRAYVAFMRFDQSFLDAQGIIKKYGWKLHDVNQNLHFILFYSPSIKMASRLVKFAKEMKSAADSRGKDFSIALNSESFEGKASFLQSFASETRKMLDFSNGRILISKSMAEISGVTGYSDDIEINGKNLTVHYI